MYEFTAAHFTTVSPERSSGCLDQVPGNRSVVTPNGGLGTAISPLSNSKS